jgi:hypothetical protein
MTTDKWFTPLAEMRPVVLRLSRDNDGCQRGERINGSAECPDCGLWWPLIEEPEEWDTETGDVVSWGPGAAECADCELVIIDTFDGAFVIRAE